MFLPNVGAAEGSILTQIQTEDASERAGRVVIAFSSSTHLFIAHVPTLCLSLRLGISETESNEGQC